MKVITPLWRIGALALMAALLSSCGPFAFGEPNLDPPVDRPAQLDFTFFAGDLVASMQRDDWPDLYLQLDADDAAILGTDRDHRFVWNENNSTRAHAYVPAENFWQESEEQRIDWPCLQGPLIVRSTLSEESVLVSEAGYCPSPGSPAYYRIETELLQPLFVNDDN